LRRHVDPNRIAVRGGDGTSKLRLRACPSRSRISTHDDTTLGRGFRRHEENEKDGPRAAHIESKGYPPLEPRSFIDQDSFLNQENAVEALSFLLKKS